MLRIAHDSDRHWLAEAVALAEREVAAGGIPFGALVVVDGLAAGRGVNRVHADRDPTAHAEVVAIRDACRRTGSPSLASATLYASAEPCALCLLAAATAGVSRVVHAVSADRAAQYGFDYRRLHSMLGPRQLWPVEAVHWPLDGAEEPFSAWRRLRTAAPRRQHFIPSSPVEAAS